MYTRHVLPIRYKEGEQTKIYILRMYTQACVGILHLHIYIPTYLHTHTHIYACTDLYQHNHLSICELLLHMFAATLMNS